LCDVCQNLPDVCTRQLFAERHRARLV
jgi:hypothetical protein